MPLVPSSTYNFQSLENDELILECFERLGISGEQIVPVKLNSARRSLNLLLLDWITKSINLWTLKTAYLSLNTGQSQYLMNSTITDILQANLRQFDRQLNGTASSTIRQLNGVADSSFGNAGNAFDGNPLTTCNEDPVTDGFISYDYGIGNVQTITSIGINSFVTRNYTINIQTSNDNVNWLILFSIPITNFIAGQTLWFNVPVPIAARAYRIIETGGAILNIQELYFENIAPNVDASNAFDGDSSTACIQNIPNGDIIYDYGLNNSQSITFVGIQSNITILYSLTVEYSQDNVNWIKLFDISPKIYTVGITEWFDVPMSIKARAYRIRETGGAILNIQEVYFTNNTVDLKLGLVSRDSYLSFPQKFLQGRPSCYYFDKQITPILNIWYSPTDAYKVIQYSYINIMKDAGGFYNIVDIPAKMLPALTWGLTWLLAIKYNPSVVVDMKNEYEQAFNIATANDNDNVGLTINYDIGSYYEN